MVMLFHLTLVFAAAKYFGLAGVNLPFSFGHAGVEFFFVLSGFIITFAHWDDFGNPSRLSAYLKKRAIRIYPVYWFVFALVCLIATGTMGITIDLAPAVLLKTLALVPQASDDPIIGTWAPTVIFVAWSLQYEILFYLLMAVFIVNRLLGGLVAAAVLVNLIACRAGYCVVSASYLQTNFVLLFGLGAATAICCKKWPTIRYARALAVVGAVAFLLTGIWDDLTGHRPTLIYGLAGAAVVIGCVTAEESKTIRIPWTWAVLLGDASYALYLVHHPVIIVMCKIAVRMGLHGVLGAAVSAPFIVAACIGSALGVHLIFEKPVMRALASARGSPKVTTAGA
jgi:exopolysaccharide production protein ExoZ